VAVLSGHILFDVGGAHRCLACDVLFTHLTDDEVDTLGSEAYCPGRVSLDDRDLD
jgi:hypothetical protein